MGEKIIDLPGPVPELFYQQALEAMKHRLVKTGFAKAVYQIGGISSPGISDLDMVVVFEDGAAVPTNFLETLDARERYLFIHNLYGISIRHFPEAERFAFYHQYRLLHGEEVRQFPDIQDSDIRTLQVQIALEYMVKMYITIFLQNAYGVIRVRDLLLHVKALQYDLEFMGIKNGSMVRHVEQVLDWRKRWFTDKPDTAEVLTWWKEFYHDFNGLLVELLEVFPFYLPIQDSYAIARNISLMPSSGAIGASHKGFILPKIFSLAGKKYFRLQNRLNQFQFNVPVQSHDIPEVISNKFQFEQTVVNYNKKYLPRFLPITSSLHAI